MRRLALAISLSICARAQNPILTSGGAGGGGGGSGSGTVTSVGLVGTANQITVTGTSPITDSGSWTLSLPTAGVTLPGTTSLANPLAVGSGGTGLATVTSNAIPKGNGTSALTVSGCLIDSSNNLSCPGTITSGSGSGVAGVIDLTQGTLPGSFPSNTWSIYSPTSIATSFQWVGPSAAASGYVKGTNSSGTVTLSQVSTIPFADGGTGLTSAADDTVMVSSGSAWVAKAVPDCTDSGGNHLNYTASTNTFSCGTSGSGASTSVANTWTAIQTFQSTGTTPSAANMALIITDSGTTKDWQFGPISTTFGGIWPGGVTPSTSNYYIKGKTDGSQLILGGQSSSMYFEISGNGNTYLDGTGWNLGGGQTTISSSGAGGSGQLTKYRNVSTANSGLSASLGTPAALTAQTASVSATTTYTTAASNYGSAGDYAVFYVLCTTTAGSAGTVTTTISWTQSSTARSFTSGTTDLTTAASCVSGTVPIRPDASTAIQYATTVSGLVGAQYSYYAWVVAY